jgi:hypothetical protein
MSGYRFHDEAEAAQLAAIAEAEGTRRREPNGHIGGWRRYLGRLRAPGIGLGRAADARKLG